MNSQDTKQKPDDYEILDSGDGAKLERFGEVVLVRPCAQACWKPALPAAKWDAATASFDRKSGQGWRRREAIPASWEVVIGGLRFRLSGTDFGHLGIFPEQRPHWRFVEAAIRLACRKNAAKPGVLNLFAYSGGATLAAARAGAEVCHVDASHGMVDWARKNAVLNGLGNVPIRWIVDDVTKFLKREQRRGRKYDAVILDPPTYGRGARGEVYKIERDLVGTMALCRALLSESPLFVLISTHTPTCTPMVLENMLHTSLPAEGSYRVDHGEMFWTGATGVLPVPCGSFACWRKEILDACAPPVGSRAGADRSGVRQISGGALEYE